MRRIIAVAVLIALAVLAVGGHARTARPKKSQRVISLNMGEGRKTIARTGPISIEARCEPGGLASWALTLLARTQRDGALMNGAEQGGDDHVGVTGTHLDEDTPEADRVLFSRGTGATGGETATGITDGVWVMGPGGKGYLGIVADSAAVYVNRSAPDERKCGLHGLLIVSEK